MSILAPFQPKPDGSGPITSGASQDIPINGPSKQICITNVGTAVVFVRLKFAADSTAATNTDQAVLPNSACILSKAAGGGTTGHTLLAMFGAGGSTVYVQSGEGW